MSTDEAQRLEERVRELEQHNAELKDEIESRHRLNEKRSEQLRALAAELMHAEQNERKRLAAHLHDHLQQILVLVKLRLDALESEVTDDGKKPLSQACVDVERAIQASRDLATKLSPPVLDEAGLGAALRWLARDFGRRYDLDVELELEDGAEPASEAVRLFLFRAVNELLFNVVKHAGVDRARLHMHPLDGDVEIRIEDDGRGMDLDGMASEKPSTQGSGLRRIEERFDVLGGRMTVESAPGEGVRIRLRAPLETPETDALEDSIPLEDGKTLVVDTEHGSATVYERDSPEPIRVLIADDHKMFREGLVGLLEDTPDVEIVAQANTGRLAVEMARSVKPDVILMDLEMPVMGGIEATRRVLSENPNIKILTLSVHDASEVEEQALAAGAHAVVTKGDHHKKLLEEIRKLVHT